MRMALCHPEKKHFAKGQCEACYGYKYRIAYNKRNPERTRQRAKRWRMRHPERAKATSLKYLLKLTPEQRYVRRLKSGLMKMYRMTLDDFNAMNAKQNGRCAICGRLPKGGHRSRRLAVDHDRACCSGPQSCGKCVRGLVCDECNFWLSAYERIGKNLLVETEAYIARSRASAIS